MCTVPQFTATSGPVPHILLLGLLSAHRATGRLPNSIVSEIPFSPPNVILPLTEITHVHARAYIYTHTYVYSMLNGSVNRNGH
jgi:hypothetical protein